MTGEEADTGGLPIDSGGSLAGLALAGLYAKGKAGVGQPPEVLLF